MIPNPKSKLLDQMREVMRLKHYSIRTERSYCDWVKRYVRFHGMKSREEMVPAEPKLEAFLSELAVKVAVSTQDQAFNALLFVYREVLHVQVGKIESVRATRPARVPVVLTAERGSASDSNNERDTATGNEADLWERAAVDGGATAKGAGRGL